MFTIITVLYINYSATRVYYNVTLFSARKLLKAEQFIKSQYEMTSSLRVNYKKKKNKWTESFETCCRIRLLSSNKIFHSPDTIYEKKMPRYYYNAQEKFTLRVSFAVLLSIVILHSHWSAILLVGDLEK